VIGKINNLDEKAKTISQVNGSLINTNAIKKKKYKQPLRRTAGSIGPPVGEPGRNSTRP